MKMKWSKRSPNDDLGDGLGDAFFILFKNVSPKNISDFRHFIGILMIWETIWETGDHFYQKSIYS